MRIETTPRDDHQVKVIAELDSDALEKFKHIAARKISERAKVPGFRPGKAPYAVVVRMFGDETVQEQAVDLMVDAVYPDILKEADLKPSGPGKLEEIVSTSPPKFSFIIPLEPEIKLGDYQTIRKEYTLEPVTDEMVNHAVKRMLRGYATAEPANRPAKTGDLVYLKLSGKLVKPVEGQEPEIFKDSPYQTVIGGEEDQPDTWPFEGFSKKLVGLSDGEEKTIPYTYPKEDAPEKFRGQKAEFIVSLESVKTLTLPELTDEFAKTLGKFETSADVIAFVRSRLEESAREEYESKYFDELLEKIAAGAVIKYPPHLLEDETAQVLRSLERNLAEQRMDLETYLKVMKLNRDDLIEKEIKPVAIRRLERSLIIEEIARAENINLEEKDLQQAYSQTLHAVSTSYNLKKMQRKVSSNRISDAIAIEAYSRVLNKQVLECLKQLATSDGTEEKPKKVVKDKAVLKVKKETVNKAKPEKEKTKAVPEEKKTRAKKTA